MRIFEYQIIKAMSENQIKPSIDYLLSTSYLLGTLEFAIHHNLPLSVEEMKQTIQTAKNQFKKESEVLHD